MKVITEVQRITAIGCKCGKNFGTDRKTSHKYRRKAKDGRRVNHFLHEFSILSKQLYRLCKIIFVYIQLSRYFNIFFKLDKNIRLFISLDNIVEEKMVVNYFYADYE